MVRILSEMPITYCLGPVDLSRLFLQLIVGHSHIQVRGRDFEV